MEIEAQCSPFGRLLSFKIEKEKAVTRNPSFSTITSNKNKYLEDIQLVIHLEVVDRPLISIQKPLAEIDKGDSQAKPAIS